MKIKLILVALVVCAPLTAMKEPSRCLSLKALAARQVLKKYDDLEYIAWLKSKLPPELITYLRLEWVKLRWPDRSYYPGYDQAAAIHEAAYFGLSDVIPLLCEGDGILYVDSWSESNNRVLKNPFISCGLHGTS